MAKQIGYSPTTIYLYFEDKADLMFAVVDDAYANFSRRLQTAYDSTDDPLARIRALGQAYVDFGLANPAIYQLIFMHRTDFLTKWRKGEERPRGMALLILQRAVAEAQQAGAVREGDLQGLGDSLWSMVHGFPGNAHDWDRVAHMLSTSHRVIQPDLLGFGQSAKPTRFEDVWVHAQATAE